MDKFFLIAATAFIGLGVTYFPRYQDARVREAVLQEQNRRLHEENLRFDGYRQAIQDSN